MPRGRVEHHWRRGRVLLLTGVRRQLRHAKPPMISSLRASCQLHVLT
ncbi:hypothetical protein HMPREF9586_00672 [Cutibacterium acnes HL083PA2]|nr:hypothetical protein HMPREF9586_00672 [Cutibacterium acnes HL083PA2]